MSRITDRLVVQRVADEIVFLDQLTGDEIVFSVEVVPNVVAAMAYLNDPEGEWLTEYVRKAQAQAWHYGKLRGRDQDVTNPYGDPPEPWRANP